MCFLFVHLLLTIKCVILDSTNAMINFDKKDVNIFSRNFNKLMILRYICVCVALIKSVIGETNAIREKKIKA